MDQNAWIMLLVGIAVSCGLIALGVVLYPKLRNERQGYPFEAQIEAALLPAILQAICVAYRMSEKGMDECRKRLNGLDKQNIAIKVYAMLPERIGTFDLTLIKRVVPQERFNQLVQNAFDDFDRFFVEHESHFDDLFEQWKATNDVSSAAQPSA
jgi:hypothetical protein